MATDQTTTEYVGFGLTDTRVFVWEAETAAGTDYTQASPLPGVPVPQQQTGLSMRTTGGQSAASTLEIRTVRGGNIRPDRGAAYAWKDAADADTAWRGWEPPQAISAFEYVRLTDGTVQTLKYTRNPHAITLADHTVLCVHEERDTAETSTLR